MKTKSILTIILSLFIQLGYCQNYGVQISTGFMEMHERVYSMNDNFQSSINFAIPLSIGLVRQSEKNQFYIGYQFQNMGFVSAPRFQGKSFDTGHSFEGPNVFHGVNFNYSRSLTSATNFLSAEINTELQLGYIPVTKYYDIITDWDTTTTNYYTGVGRDTIALYRGVGYSRTTSDFYAVVKLGMNLSLNFKNGVKFTINPNYGVGLIDFYKNNLWYEDYERGETGTATIISSGNQFGVVYRLTYLINKNSK